MSVSFITHHDETIYDIRQITDLLAATKEGKEVPQMPRYVTPPTHFKEFIIKELMQQKRKRRSVGIMGRPKQALPDPKSYLRKHTGKVFAVDGSELDVQPPPGTKKAPVPKTICSVYEQMHKLHHDSKNFVHQNVVNAVRMKPKEPVRKEIMDAKSNNFRIVPKEPVQVSNKIFAKIPRYLDAKIKERQALIESLNEEKGIVKQKCTYITRDERKILLEGLKKNWDELQRVYQGLPILTDTIPKKARKRDLETQLQQLEKDIVLIERHPFIYVYDEDEDDNKHASTTG